MLADIMKYHHLAFTLLSAGTHVHILRLLTYTEASAYVVTKNEVPDRRYAPDQPQSRSNPTQRTKTLNQTDPA